MLTRYAADERSGCVALLLRPSSISVSCLLLRLRRGAVRGVNGGARPLFVRDFVVRNRRAPVLPTATVQHFLVVDPGPGFIRFFHEATKERASERVSKRREGDKRYPDRWSQIFS